MSDEQQENNASQALKPLRVWPAAILLLAMAVLWLLGALAGPDRQFLVFVSFMGRLAAGLLLPVWWLAASRTPVKERLGGFIGLIAIAGLTALLLHPTMRGPGMMLITVPLGMAVFGVTALLCRRMPAPRRTVILLLATACAFAVSLFFRNEGMWSNGALALQFRWSPTAEESQSAVGDAGVDAENLHPLDAAAAVNLNSPAWPEFRGPGRVSQQHGSRIATDWKATPPEERWRISIGPAWSSFAVAGDLLFSQEQRGPREAVSCYNATNGQLHWITEIESRFADPLGGPGPRATPTLHEGALYAMGAEGFLLRLAPLTGEIVWQADLRVAADRDPPAWGFSSSPLVVDDVVIVHAGGAGDKGILAYDTTSGDLRWSAPAGDHTYSSPQLASINGKNLVLVLTNTGLNVLAPSSGDVQLNYEWSHNGYRALQPQPIGDGTFFLPSGMGTGSRRIKIAGEGDALAVEELWTATDFRPDFNDCVFQAGYAYGFDGGRFVCFDLDTGERVWRGGNYGKGQVLLLADASQLLVTTEKGDIVIVEATSEAPVELARFNVFDGKTWNHPVLVGDQLYIRNAEEAACYQVPLAAQV